VSRARVTLAPAARALCVVLLLVPCAAQSLTFDFPGSAVVAGGRSDPMSSILLPLGPWTEGGLPSRQVEGALDQTVWQIDAPGLTTLQLLAPLRDQIRAAGFEVLWECDTRVCGGFDFRYALDVLPEPDMHVDLGDFRFLAAERTAPGDPATITLLVSRSARKAFVQVTQIGSAPAEAAPAAQADPVLPTETEPQPVPDTDIARALERFGAMALDDLTFATGSAALGPGEFASLRSVAAYLADHPERRVALVGHTDASGDLAGNVALSKSRAASVRDRLIRDYGAPANRVTADGVGYLAPRASNLTGEGRTRNRRVEVVLTSIR
jgi:outer membrane protein OmpA-like peptidoglycan-associated protein